MTHPNFFNNSYNLIKSNFLFIVLFVLSFVIIGNIYTLPNETIWDETYYIPAVEKYKKGVFFMESHPPLGKLLMTAGDIIVNPNAELSQLNPLAKFCMNKTFIDYNGTRISVLDYRSTYPLKIDNSKLTESNNINDTNKLDRGYSFCGIRFVPTIFAIMIPLLLFLIIELITGSQFISFFITSFTVFDNALLTHYRAGMIDGIQMVFILIALYYTIKIIKQNNNNWNWFFMLVFIAFAISTKHNGIFLLIIPFLILATKINFKSLLKLVTSYGLIVLIYFAIFSIHIDNGRNLVVNSQDRYGYYNADDKTKEYLSNTSNEFNVFNIFVSNIEYMNNYHLRVPVLDTSNPNENGSRPISWLLMNKTIQYNSVENKKLVLLGNPIIWAISLVTVFMALFEILKLFVIHDLSQSIYYKYLIVLSSLYFCYYALMFLSSNLRVMYLYHYLVNLVLTFIMLGIIIKIKNWDKKENRLIFGFLYLLILIGFGIVSPLTYYLPTDQNYIINRWVK